MDEGTLKWFNMHCLASYLSSYYGPPNVDDKPNESLAELMVPLEVDKVANMLVGAAEKGHRRLPIAVKALVTCYEDGERALKIRVDQRIIESLISGDEEAFEAALRMARLTCAAVTRRAEPGRSHYGQWFAAAFGQETTSLVNR